MIYLLHENPSENAKMLADNDLGKMIEALAQVLCNVHYIECNYKSCTNHHKELVPEIDWESFDRAEDEPIPELIEWARTCLANYKYLVDMALACCEEWEYRNNKYKCLYGRKYIVYENGERKEYEYKRHKLQPVIEFARDNVPELPNHYYHKSELFAGHNHTFPVYNEPTPFPLCVPKQYIEILSTTVREGQPCPVDVVQSYRNAYRAKIKKKVNKFISGGLDEEIAYKINNLYFTRREKPQWLEI